MRPAISGSQPRRDPPSMRQAAQEALVAAAMAQSSIGPQVGGERPANEHCNGGRGAVRAAWRPRNYSVRRNNHQKDPQYQTRIRRSETMNCRKIRSLPSRQNIPNQTLSRN
jgi:hypothetical protein